MRLWIGVDGGGTHSVLAAVRSDGAVVGYRECGGLNFYTIGMDAARERLRTAVRGLLDDCGAEDYIALGVGSSALDGRAERAVEKAFAGDAFPVDRIELCGDCFMAQCGANLGQAGVAVVSGTGAMVLGVDADGAEHLAGGWGYRLGDPGSAYGVATAALRAVFAAEEGLGEPSGLREAALRFFGARSVRGLIAPLYAETSRPSDIALFASEVIAQADGGDAVAARILEEQYRALARQTARVWDACSGQICLWGGMFTHNAGVRALFERLVRGERERAFFGEAALPPELGAVVWAMKKRGALTQAILETMQKTGRRCER